MQSLGDKTPFPPRKPLTGELIAFSCQQYLLIYLKFILNQYVTVTKDRNATNGYDYSTHMSASLRQQCINNCTYT